MGELLLHPGPGHAVGLHHLVEVGNDQALDMEITIDPPILHTLDCSGYSAEDPHLVSTEI